MKIFWLNKHLKEEEEEEADPFIMQFQTKRKKIMKPKKSEFQSQRKEINQSIINKQSRDSSSLSSIFNFIANNKNSY